MKLTIKYDALVKHLNLATMGVSSNNVSEEVKNIIFKIENNKKVTIMSYNPMVVCRETLEDDEFILAPDENIEDKDFYFQIKAKELNNFLKTFSNLNVTVADNCTFIKKDVHIELQVLELPKDESLTYLKRVSTYSFDDIPLKDYIVSEINVGVEESELKEVESADILKCIKNLYPLVKNAGSGGTANKIFFSKEYVFCTSVFATLMKNNISDVVNGISLSTDEISIIMKILGTTDKVSVLKSDIHFVLHWGNNSVFVRYKTKMVDTNMYLESYKKKYNITVNRKYLRDLIKRFALLNEPIQVEVKLDENKVQIKNSKINADLPIMTENNISELGLVRFKVTHSILDKAMIGEDKDFDEELQISFVPFKKGGYTVALSDKSDNWFSLIQVR